MMIPNTNPVSNTLHPDHSADLRKSLLTDETIRLCGFSTWDDPQRIGNALR